MQQLNQAATAGMVQVTHENLVDVLTDPAMRAKALAALDAGATVHGNAFGLRVDGPSEANG